MFVFLLSDQTRILEHDAIARDFEEFAEIQRMWASDGMVPRRKEPSSKTAQGFALRWATPFSMKMTTQQQ